MQSLLAATTPPVVTAHWHPVTMIEALISATVFGVLGLALLMFGFKLFDWLTPKLDLEKELAEKNMAVALALAALFIGLGYIVAHSISG